MYVKVVGRLTSPASTSLHDACHHLPLYAICASNDVAVSMMDGNSGLSLTQEVIDEAVDFRQAMARLYKEFAADGSWFFKPWNKEVVTDPQTGKTYDFADAPTKLLTTVQDCWVMHPGESWHGFKDIPDNWSMLDPIKVSILAPGMGEDGELEETGVPAALVTARLGRHGIVPTRTTDFQIMFLFSMGVTRGKWGLWLTPFAPSNATMTPTHRWRR